MRHVLILVAAFAVLVSCAQVPSVDAALDRKDFSTPEPIEDFADLPQGVLGTWASRGYGWIFEITPEGMTQYQVTRSHCFETPDASKGLTSTLALDYSIYREGPDGDTLILQLLPEDTEIWLDRIETRPDACDTPAGSDAATVFDYFAELVGENYVFFEERGIDWASRVNEARPDVETGMDDEALFSVLASMIDGFSDSHTKLIAPIGDGVRRQQDGLGETLPRLRSDDRETEWLIGIFSGLMEDVLDPGSQHTANDRILWGTIDDGRVGYIQILQMGGFSGVDIADPSFRQTEFDVFDQVMDEALSAMTGADFVIVDLSNNRGGYDAISRRVASRFTDEVFDAYQTYVPGADVPARMRRIEPADSVRFSGPVKLLTSDVTVSGGEIATLALRQLPNVTHYGQTTRGSFSTVLSKPLPNGWVAELSNEVIAAPDGTSFEETGIPPQEPIEVFGLHDPVSSHRHAIETLAGIAAP